MKKQEFTERDALDLKTNIIKNLVYEADANPNLNKKAKNLTIAYNLIGNVLVSMGINLGGAEPKKDSAPEDI